MEIPVEKKYHYLLTKRQGKLIERAAFKLFESYAPEIEDILQNFDVLLMEICFIYWKASKQVKVRAMFTRASKIIPGTYGFFTYKAQIQIELLIIEFFNDYGVHILAANIARFAELIIKHLGYFFYHNQKKNNE